MKRALAALLLLAAGCGGDARLPELALLPEGRSGEREPGLVVMRFVQAARSADTDRMRALSSAATRASFGAGAYEEVARQLAGFSGGRVVLSRPLEARWAVGAVAGFDDDGDRAAWGAALRQEEAGWRIELGGVFFTRVRPAPLREVEPRAEVRIEAQAGGEVDDVRIWVGRRELRAHAVRRAPFTREVWGRLVTPLPPGEHTAVAFARAGDTAGAFAWPFEVER